MYNKVDTNINYPENEAKVLKFWQENNIKEKVLKLNSESDKNFLFYEGPPTANGAPHAGHVLTRSLKDVYTRYYAMKGYFVPRKGGWDTHGLPVEISVEKQLGIEGKKGIEDYGIDKFVQHCKKDVWSCIDRWKEFSNAVGYSVNLEDDCYVTYYNDYIESVWWSLKEFDKKGLLYKGYKILPSCPSCGTALSSHEVDQGYKDRKDLTVVAKFKLCNEENTYVLAWTTTPWTLPSNVALCVNGEEDYALVLDKDGTKYILAKALVEKHFKENYEVLKTFKGETLVGKYYEPLFNYYDNSKKDAFKIVSDGYVTLLDGTGVVHIAPAFGDDDSKVGKKYNLPFVQFVTPLGKFTEECKELAGKDVFAENENIALTLLKEGKVFSTQKVVHSYPHCWRCKTPLIYYARSGWFIKTTAFKDVMLKENNKINWIPETLKDGRMGNFLKNNIDWCLSRDRYWGTPLPVWECECGHHHTVGSKEELSNLTDCSKDIELHRPYIDNLTFNCPTCGKPMHRVNEVIDCWYDSGAMPFAQFHYPFENKDIFEKRFPADFIAEGKDQTRGWFYSLLAISCGLFGKAPFKTCISNGMILDEKGIKMSKSLGNYVDPMVYLRKYGADAIRFNFYSTTQPYNDAGFTEQALQEVQRTFLNTLYNTYAFYVLYADIDKFDPSTVSLKDVKLNIMDKWILSKFTTMLDEVQKLLDNYDATTASRTIKEFCNSLSNWYIRRCRKRYWVSDFSDNKKAAYATLYYVLSNLSKVCAPFTPFIAEEIYQNIERPFFSDSKESVHLCSYPKCDYSYINKELEEQMDSAVTYCELGRSARTLSNIKIRQPLKTLYVTDATGKAKLNDELKEIIKDELNVKEVVYEDSLDEFVDYMLKPQLKTLGPKYGKILNNIKEFLLNVNAKEVLKQVKNGGVYKTLINGVDVELNEQDLLVSTIQQPGLISATSDHLAVVLDGKLTNDLIEEGIIRELISKIQSLRKEKDFFVADHIKITFANSNEYNEVFKKYESAIKNGSLADEIVYSDDGEFDTLDLFDKELKIHLSKI